MVKIQSVIARILAVFGSSALAALAGGAVVGIELWKAAAVSGFIAAGKVTESILKSWAEDGVLTKEEVAAAFGKKGDNTASAPAAE